MPLDAVNAISYKQTNGQNFYEENPRVSLHLTPHEALIYIMITMSAVDKDLSDKELARIGSIVKNLPVFEGFDVEKLIKISSSCGEALGADNGLTDVLKAIGLAIPPKLKDTAYAVAVEISVADWQIEQEEIRFLQMLRDTLGLDKLTTAAIEHGAIARHQKL